MKSSRFQNLADDRTTLAKGPAKRCPSDMDNVDISVARKIRKKHSIVRSLVDDDTMSVEGPAEGCRSEIVGVDVSVARKISEEALDASQPCRR